MSEDTFLIPELGLCKYNFSLCQWEQLDGNGRMTDEYLSKVYPEHYKSIQKTTKKNKHYCDPPVDPDSYKSPLQWNCPECHKAWELHTESWYQPKTNLKDNK